MFPFIAAAVILFIGLIAGALTLINYTARIEFKEMADAIQQQLNLIRTLAGTQNINVNSLIPTVKAFTTYEQDTFNAATKAAERLGKAQTPGQLQDANKSTNRALDNLSTVTDYYPPLLIDRDYLTANEKVTDTRDELQRAIVHYNTEVARYNQKLNQFSNRLLSKKVGLEPFGQITLPV